MFCRLILLIFICFSSCVFGGKKQARHVELAQKIIAENIAFMQKKFGMHPTINGGGFYKQVNEIHSGFGYYGYVDIPTARYFQIIGTQDLLARTNACEEIRPYLKNYPFSCENVYYSISFYGKDDRSITQEGSGKDPNKLATSVSSKGKVSYDIQNEDKFYYQEVYREPYEEALEIVKRDYPEDFEDLGN